MSMRPNLHAANIALAGLPDADAALVQREAGGGTEASLCEALDLQVRAEQETRTWEATPVPQDVAQNGWAPGWAEAARRAAVLGTSEAADRTLDAHAPEMLSEAEGIAEEAAVAVPAAREAVVAAQAEERTLIAYYDTRTSAEPPSAELSAQERRKRMGVVLCCGAEALGVLFASTGYFGLGDGMPLASVPAATWLQVTGLTVSGAIGLFLIAYLAGEAARRMSFGTAQVRAAFVACVGALLFVAAGFGVIRWAAAHDAYSISGAVERTGASAILVVVAIATLACAVAATWARLQADELAHRARTRRGEEEERISALAKARTTVEGCEAHLTRLLGEARLPSTLRAAFERSVSIAVEQEAKLAQERAHRIAQGVGAFRLIHALPPELRAVPSAHVFRLIDRSAPSRAGDGHPADAAPSRSTLATRIRGAGQAGLLLVGLGTASGTALLPGCAEPTAPADAIVACDGTGVEPGEVCTRELLACRFAAWAETASFHPGATFTVVTGAGSFGATSVAYRAVVPASWSSRSARPAWIRAQLAELASITIPQDSSAGERSPNQSDLISLVSVATREAAARSAPVDLLVATDGWFVSLGFDTEKDGVPPTEGLVARLHASGMPWNLSAFSAVTLCGLHSRGVDGGRVVARDGAWRALFAEGHAPAPRLLPSCSGLYPPVAPALLEAGDAESAEESSR